MKLMILNASPHPRGNTSCMIDEMVKIFDSEHIETEIVQIGQKAIRSCIACGHCAQTGQCVFDDEVNAFAEKFEKADGLLVATPVYYAGANPTLTAFLTRLFYSTHYDKTMKTGASVVVARRGGTTAALDEINRFFVFAGMPVAPSQYWAGAHGGAPGEVLQDEEGMQIMRTAARNISFMIKSLALGKETFGLPEQEARLRTNFIR